MGIAPVAAGMIRAVIFGGRHLDPARVFAWLLRNFVPAMIAARPILALPDTISIIDGVATGGDEGGFIFAIPFGYHTMQFPMRDANDGPNRNGRMVSIGLPHIGFEFPGGRGTANMHKRCVEARIPLVIATGDFGFIRRPIRRQSAPVSETNKVYL